MITAQKDTEKRLATESAPIAKRSKSDVEAKDATSQIIAPPASANCRLVLMNLWRNLCDHLNMTDQLALSGAYPSYIPIVRLFLDAF